MRFRRVAREARACEPLPHARTVLWHVATSVHASAQASGAPSLLLCLQPLSACVCRPSLLLVLAFPSCMLPAKRARVAARAV